MLIESGEANFPSAFGLSGTLPTSLTNGLAGDPRASWVGCGSSDFLGVSFFDAG